ncbi:MAG: HD domain-containing phosphohydrolase [Candidatus Dormibacter sp.]
MVEKERIPADFHQAMFRIAAIAFVTSATVNVASSFVGKPHFDFRAIFIIGILSYAGAAVSWFFPWHRLPVQRFLVVIVAPGLVLLGFMLMLTGGIHSHILPVFVAPAVFMAAAYGFRSGAIIALMTAATATLPLLVQGWDTYYARTLIVLAVGTMLCAYIPARVRRALLAESENRQRQQEESYVATIGALAAALDAKDRYTEEHSRETAAFAVSVGKRLGLSAEQRRLLEYGALLHDIGKIGIPSYILHKPDALTAEEFTVMKEHPVIGERILASVPFLAPLGPIVRAEHERWDGAGYPDGLKGEEIPIEARIIHACDAFHAMASHRSYRVALTPQAILKEFQDGAGTQFDPRVVEVLLRVIEEEKPKVTAIAQTSGTPAPAAPLSGPRSWAQHLQTIEALGQQLARASSVEDICSRMGETIVTLLPHDHIRILLVDQDRARLDVVYLSGSDHAEYKEVTRTNAAVDIGEGITGWVAETKRGAVLGDAERHPKAAHVAGTAIIEESMLVVPVVFQDEVLAVIAVMKLGLNQYSLDQLRLLTILGNQAAVSMANARLIDRLAASARIDTLTGLLNRPAFEEALNTQLVRPQSWGSLLILDVDNLREVNRAYGYRAGDAVLKKIARAVSHNLPPGNPAARWMGDDFVILALETDRAQAGELAKQIEAGLQSDRISIRWGLAEYRGDGLTAQDLLGRAIRSLTHGAADVAA